MDKLSKKEWELYSWVKRGKQRVIVLKAFPGHPITPQELRAKINEKEDVKLSLPEVSRHMTSFKEKGLVRCLDEDAPYGKHYELTDLGFKIEKHV